MKAKVIVNKNYTIGETDKRIYGSFIEHMGRAVYSGIYEPEHKTADENGFREDVLELVRALDVPIIRYPGGNFVSAYNWEDGIGDKEKRPNRVELAWGSIETNDVGLDEFSEWAKKAGSEIMMAVNLGTRGADDARNLLEYCNLDTDTYYANLRRENGFDKPFGIKTWCLGNEMDGPWQIGRKTPKEYARLAIETAKIMKRTDPSIELVACGSSLYDMDTFGEWELTVLDEAYDKIDYISLHQYYGNEEDNAAEFLGRSVHMDKFIKGVASMCDAIKAKKHSDKTVNLSFDEWNVWYRTMNEKYDRMQIAPPILEEKYNFEDALLVGCMLMTLQNNCDRVKIACLAQLVNVIAPIMTEKGGKAWKQTIFYPYYFASKYGRGQVMDTIVTSESYETGYEKNVPYIETSVIHDEEKRRLTVYAVNRSLTDDMEFEINFEGFESVAATEHIELYCDNLKAENSAKEESVSPKNVAVTGKECKTQTVTLKKHSWNMIIYKY